VEDNFFELGGDSILSIQIVSRAGRAGLRVSPRQLFEQQTVAGLASVAGAVPAVAAEQGRVVGEVALTPIQRWFLEQELPERHHFNQSAWVELGGEVDREALEWALAAVVWHHDALRLRVERGSSGWRQHLVGREEAELLGWVDLAEVEPSQRSRVMAEEALRVQGSLDLEAGPVVRAVLFGGEPGEACPLLVVVHHLAVDGVSWRILLEDLETAYAQVRAGREVRLPAKTTSYREWARRLEEHAAGAAVSAEAGHWLDERREEVGRLPVDHAGGENRVSSSSSVEVSLDGEETRRLLQEVPSAYRTQINDVLLTALGEALSGWTGGGPVVVDLEGHGREEEVIGGVDLSRTVGWFTSLFPVLLDVDERGDPGRSLRSVKERLRSVPGKGLGYGLLRYLGPDGEVSRRLAALPEAEVSFNYLGQFSSRSGWMPLGRPGLPGGLDCSATARRAHLVDVVGAVVDGELRVWWTYSREVHEEATVRGVAEAFAEGLRGLIAHCCAPEAGGLTPSDVPLADLDQATLDRLLV
jgi:non-ribosomal peptide synthase protein (TIGR01720 family)